MKTKSPISRKKGVALILSGLTVIIVITLLLWGMWRPLDVNQRLRSTELMLVEIGSSLEMFRNDFKRYPSTKEGLPILTPAGSNRESAYLYPSAKILDGWEHFFVYRETPNAVHPFELYSVGSNGVDENGAGDDINFWNQSGKSR